MGWLKKLLGSSEGGAVTATLPGERVLVADESITIQKVVELTLAEQGCSVAAAGTGDEAIASLSSSPPSVVLVGTSVPGRSALDVCAAVRARAELGGTIVVMMRGAFEPGFDDARLRMAGVDAMLVKPFEPAALIELLRGLRLARPAAS